MFKETVGHLENVVEYVYVVRDQNLAAIKIQDKIFDPLLAKFTECISLLTT